MKSKVLKCLKIALLLVLSLAVFVCAFLVGRSFKTNKNRLIQASADYQYSSTDYWYKNYLPFPYVDSSKTSQGITYTVLADGRILCNGTSTGYSTFVLCNDSSKLDLIPGTVYTFSSSGSDVVNNPSFIILYYDENGEKVYKNEGTFTWQEDYEFLQFYIQIAPNVTVTNKFLSPMLGRGSNVLPFIPNLDGVYNDGYTDGYDEGYLKGITLAQQGIFYGSHFLVDFSNGGEWVRYEGDTDSSIVFNNAFDFSSIYNYIHENYPAVTTALTIQIQLKYPVYSSSFPLRIESPFALTSDKGILYGDVCYYERVGDSPFVYNVLPDRGYGGDTDTITFTGWNISDFMGLRLFVYPNYYQFGYDAGQAATDSYNVGYDRGYTVGHRVGYDKGYDKGLSHDNTFFSLMSAVVDAPVQTFVSLLDFDIFGYNMSALAKSVLTVCLLLAVVRFFSGG